MNSPRQSPPKQWALRTSRFLNRHSLLPFAAFLVGIVVGMVGTGLVILSMGSDRPAFSILPSRGGEAVIAQASKTFVTQLIEKNVRAAGLPGEVSNVQVKLVHDGPIVVSGDDQLGILGIGITKHFRFDMQPFVRSCQLRVHVLHADLDGIPVTAFAALFEDRINQQLEIKLSGLPQGFVYCMVGVHVEPQAVFVSYSATPV